MFSRIRVIWTPLWIFLNFNTSRKVKLVGNNEVKYLQNYDKTELGLANQADPIYLRGSSYATGKYNTRIETW